MPPIKIPFRVDSVLSVSFDDMLFVWVELVMVCVIDGNSVGKSVGGIDGVWDGYDVGDVVGNTDGFELGVMVGKIVDSVGVI